MSKQKNQSLLWRETLSNRQADSVTEENISTVMDYLAADIADNVLNPLTSIKGLVQLCGSGVPHAYQELIISELNRIEFMVHKCLILSTKPLAAQWKKQDLKVMLEQSVSMVDSQAETQGIDLKLEIPNDLPLVMTKGNLLQIALTGIVQHIVQSMPAGGILSIQLKPYSKQMFMHFLCERGAGHVQHTPGLACSLSQSEEKTLDVSIMAAYKIIHEHHGKIRLSEEHQQENKLEKFSIHIGIPYNHMQCATKN